MSAVVQTPAPIDIGAAASTSRHMSRQALSRQMSRTALSHPALLWPLLVSVASAVAFVIVQPSVTDLQAALARASAARNGVGLGYWFGWFGGGATPGNYSVISPFLSALIGAALSGALATIALTPLVYALLAGTSHRILGTWAATITYGLNLWSGRIPFALGSAMMVGALIAVRQRRTALACVLAVLSGLFSPVTGAFLALMLAATFLVEPTYRRVSVIVGGAGCVTLLGLAVLFGNPGPQHYSINSGLLTMATAAVMLAARPHLLVRVVLWLALLGVPVLLLVPNGMGSNFVRLPYICAPVAVVATATIRRRYAVLCLLPAIVISGTTTIGDIVRANAPTASSDYYATLRTQLTGVPDLANYRLEVVQDKRIHTDAYALLGNAALAGGWESQEQNRYNKVLSDATRLDATSFKIWLDNNAVGFVALSSKAGSTNAEYRLITIHPLPYLHRVSSDRNWTLFKVDSPNPIVPKPARLVSATQASMSISVPCACAFTVRVRYSRFLDASATNKLDVVAVGDDGAGWTLVRTSAPGILTLSGSLTRPFR